MLRVVLLLLSPVVRLTVLLRWWLLVVCWWCLLRQVIGDRDWNVVRILVTCSPRRLLPVTVAAHRSLFAGQVSADVLLNYQVTRDLTSGLGTRSLGAIE